MIIIIGSENTIAKELTNFLVDQGYKYLVKVDQGLPLDNSQFYPSFPATHLNHWLEEGSNSSLTEFIIDLSFDVEQQMEVQQLCSSHHIAYIGIGKNHKSSLFAQPYYYGLLQIDDQVELNTLKIGVLSLLVNRNNSGVYDLTKINESFEFDQKDYLSNDVLINYWNTLQSTRT